MTDLDGEIFNESKPQETPEERAERLAREAQKEKDRQEDRADKKQQRKEDTYARTARDQATRVKERSQTDPENTVRARGANGSISKDNYVYEINDDGTYKRDANGNPIGRPVKYGGIRGFGSIIGASAEVQKKLYNMEPTIIQVEAEYYTGEATPAHTSFSVAVKVLTQIIPSDEVIKFLPKAKTEMNFFIKLARAYTGEISFFKDIILRINDAKGFLPQDQRSLNDWYSNLKKKREALSFNSRVHSGKVLATASMALAIEEVEQMKNKTNGKFDLLNPAEAKKTMDALGLINLIICDEANKKMWFFNDTDSNWDIRSDDDVKKNNDSIKESDLLKLVLLASGR
jgi:hypothetical protein